MMNQICKELNRGGMMTIADQINNLLSENQLFELESVTPLPISKIGGTDYHYLVVFRVRPAATVREAVGAALQTV